MNVKPPQSALRTGVCYYPEHWPETRWHDDAAHMRRLGLSVVRIGEFAWSRLESPDGELHLEWLERAINTLHAAGLSVVLGTPTATPPAWLVDRHPGIIAIDEHGQPRGFGSRRHYCFSYHPYREDCARIVTALAKRFGEHPAIIAWQTDNEYGCHDTILSYSDAAISAFRQWCKKRYGNIETLNSAWGNVFWSMEYQSFEEIGAPALTVTETNPSHRLAWWRCAGDQVIAFDRVQVDIIRQHSPGRDVLHNFMGNFVEFDHHALSQHLDIATWDNYPLGFLTRDGEDPEEQRKYLRTGAPDSSAFHHDLYRGCCNGRFWVMEQQPGPVNWAPYNPAPLDGMARLWGWEAFAHGAEVTSWFRWRQAPFGQEQMHTGLLLSNGEEDVAAKEVEQVAKEIAVLESADVELTTQPASVAIVFDYAGDRAQRIQQPGGRTHDPLQFVQRVHSACRRLGLDVDIVATEAPLNHYALVLVPNATIDDAGLVKHLAQTTATVVLFPRTGSRDTEAAIPESLPPGHFRTLIDVTVIRSETLPPEEKPIARAMSGAPAARASTTTRVEAWRERITSPLPPAAVFDDGWGFHYTQGRVHYINAIPDPQSLFELLQSLCESADLDTTLMPEGVRTRRRGDLRFAFNVSQKPYALANLFSKFEANRLLLGNDTLAPASLSVWREKER